MKRGTPDHWKMKDLAKRLKIPLPYAVGIMELLWHYTAKYHPRGDIGAAPDWAIADACGWDCGRRSDRVGQDPDKLAAFVDALVASKWLDRDKTCRILVHDWSEHADGSVKKYLKDKGLSFLSPTLDGPQDLQPLPLPLPLPNPFPKPLPSAPPRGDDLFERLYKLHPKKGHRTAAEMNLAQSVASGADPEEIERIHRLWCETEWAGTQGRFAPFLDQWLVDQGWKYLPTEGTLALPGNGGPGTGGAPAVRQTDELIRRLASGELND